LRKNPKKTPLLWREGMEGRGKEEIMFTLTPAYRQAGNPLLSEPEAHLSRRPSMERGNIFWKGILCPLKN